MIDATEVTEFALRLGVPVEVIEEPWRDEWSEKVATDMRSLAPVDTGTLRDSITVTADGVEVLADYGIYVERGTSDTPPQPFVLPAVNQNAEPAAADLGRRVIHQLT
jgi:HK97 gp10 family phage protein